MSRRGKDLGVAALLLTGCVVHELGSDTVERNLEGPPLELAPGEGARFEIGVIASSPHAEGTYGSILRVTAELERADDASAVRFEVAGPGGRTWADLSVPDPGEKGVTIASDLPDDVPFERHHTVDFEVAEAATATRSISWAVEAQLYPSSDTPVDLDLSLEAVAPPPRRE